MTDTGYRLVIDQANGGFAQGFDRDTVYEFTRDLSAEPKRYKLSDQQPAFNVAGLWFRAGSTGDKG